MSLLDAKLLMPSMRLCQSVCCIVFALCYCLHIVWVSICLRIAIFCTSMIGGLILHVWQVSLLLCLQTVPLSHGFFVVYDSRGPAQCLSAHLYHSNPLLVCLLTLQLANCGLPSVTVTLWSRGRTYRLTLSPCSVLFRVLCTPKISILQFQDTLTIVPFQFSPPAFRLCGRGRTNRLTLSAPFRLNTHCSAFLFPCPLLIGTELGCILTQSTHVPTSGSTLFHFPFYHLAFRLSRRSRGGCTPPDSQSGPKPGQMTREGHRRSSSASNSISASEARRSR